MDKGQQRTMVAYLLRRLPEPARTEFEARLLEEPGLLDNVRRLEERLLAGELEPRGRARARCIGCFAAGLVIGVLGTLLLAA